MVAAALMQWSGVDHVEAIVSVSWGFEGIGSSLMMTDEDLSAGIRCVSSSSVVVKEGGR